MGRNVAQSRSATTSIVNAQSTSPCAALSIPNLGVDHNVKSILTGALVAGTLKPILSLTNTAGDVDVLALLSVDATARTLALRVTIDGVTSPYAFDSTTNSFSAANTGIVAAGLAAAKTSTSIPTTTDTPLSFNNSFIVEAASSLGETDKSVIFIRYKTRSKA